MKFLKLLVMIALLGFVGMLWWSSTIVEEEVKELKKEIARLRVTGSVQRPAKIVSRSWDLSLPNLLQEDPFYRTTLPKILGPDFVPHGTLRVGTIAKPHNLHPMAGWKEINEAWQACTTYMGRSLVGSYDQYSSGVALRVEERNPGEYWLFLRTDLDWAPLDPKHFPEELNLSTTFFEPHPVTAHDVKFWFDAMMNPFNGLGGAVGMRTYYSDVEEVRIIDDYTLVVRWKADPDPKYISRQLTMTMKPLARFVYNSFPDGSPISEGEIRQDSVWAQNFADHWAKNIIVSCGPWIFDRWHDGVLKLKRNPNYFEPLAALTEYRTTYFFEIPDTAWQAFKADKIDLFDMTRAPEKRAELSDFLNSPQGRGVQQLPYLERAYAYIGWNLNNPLFQDRRVRQALTLAVDRTRLIEQNLNARGLVAKSAFFPKASYANQELEPYPYDLRRARALLEEAGWHRSASGLLEKDGKSFSFQLYYLVKNPFGRLNADFISTSLRQLGIDCRPLGLDIADISLAFEGKEFDAIQMAWRLGAPPPDPYQLWHSSGADQKGSSNFIGFQNFEVDQIIEALRYEYDLQVRNQLYHRFEEILHDESPYTFLYVPMADLLYRSRVQNVFIPVDRPDLTPNADVSEPNISLFYLDG